MVKSYVDKCLACLKSGILFPVLEHETVLPFQVTYNGWKLLVFSYPFYVLLLSVHGLTSQNLSPIFTYKEIDYYKAIVLIVIRTQILIP